MIRLCVRLCYRSSEEDLAFILCKVNQPLKSCQMIYGGPSQHADDRMMDFLFLRKEKEGMISESCRSLCTALDSRKHAQVCLREDMS